MRAAWAGILFLPLLCAQSSDLNRLPVKRVVLYKNGVGYFEHLGRVRDNQDVTISFTSGQLNDVLKSLTVLDLNGGRISGVAYGSSAPIDKRLGDLRLPLSEKTSLTEFLGALRGARLEVRNAGTTITGRLLSVERKTHAGGGATLEVDYIALLTDSGEVKTTEVSPAFSVKLLERGLTDKVDRYLDLVSSEREPDLRKMVVSTAGSGDRSVFVSYISEVPVWKTTYRVVLSSKPGQSPLLQGWAIVDNTVGENWENVELSLVAGAPQSFVENLSQPYYARRPVVSLPESVNMSPQTYESTLIPGGARITGRVTDPTGAPIPGAVVKALDARSAVVAEVATNGQGGYELNGLPDGRMRLEFEKSGFRRETVTDIAVSIARTTAQDVQLSVGSTAESVTVTAQALPLVGNASSINRMSTGNGNALGSGAGLGGRVFNKFAPASPPPPATVEAARARVQAAALAQNLGDLFEYKLKEPITIQKNRSALVPVVQSSVKAEKVSVWNEQSGIPRPRRALWLENSTGLTLDGGSFSVLDEETFAGEGIVEPIRPGEKRLISYAIDLAVNTDSRQGSERQRVARVRISHGVMTQESEIQEKKTYTFRNEDSAPRAIIVEHPVRPGYELRSEPRPVETTAAWMRFRLTVEPKQTASLVVEEVRPQFTNYTISGIKTEQVILFVQQKSIEKTIENALRRVLAQKAVIEDLDDQKTARETDKEKIFDDQQRLRENMKALKGSAEEKTLLQRYVQQLGDEETRLDTLRKEIEQLEAKGNAAQEALEKIIQEMSFDVKL